MKLYVANCTQQVQDFIYRLPETSSARTQRIEIGSQVRIAGDLTTQEIDSIVDQHRKYGLVEVSEVDRTKPFIGLCYDVDKPVSMDKVRVAMQHNTEVLVERGKTIRQESAVAVNNALEETASNLTALEMSVVEEAKDGSSPTIAEGTRVSRVEPESGGNGPRGRGRGNQRRAA